MGGTLFFTADDGTTGQELWKSDGTAAGTVLVKDIRPGTSNYGYPFGSNVYDLTAVGGTLYFTANDGVHGQELWQSDGTEAGTVLVKDIRPGGDGSSPDYLAFVNGALFFAANDGQNGLEPWILRWGPAGIAGTAGPRSRVSPSEHPPPVSAPRAETAPRYAGLSPSPKASPTDKFPVSHADFFTHCKKPGNNRKKTPQRVAWIPDAN